MRVWKSNLLIEMIVHSFTNDYSEGCHPSILEALNQSNFIQQAGYGDDVHTLNAVEAIRNKIEDSNAAVHLISGGTLTNLLVLSSILKPFESVIAAQTGHISTHETGAIEATGHKIEEVTVHDGKLTPELIKPVLNKFPEYHTVKPRVIYISNSTEIGTIYNKEELTDLSSFCKSNNLLLFMDGARLPSALAAFSNDLTLADAARLTDVFYIGGTKSGALLGEAVVITNEVLKKDFKYHQKQRGAMMAKGRVLGIQFEQLLKNDLILELANQANTLAARITNAVFELGYSFLTKSDTNQIFPILPNRVIDKLILKYEFYVWEPIDSNNSAIRIVTSWATPEDRVDMFIHDLKEASVW